MANTLFNALNQMPQMNGMAGNFQNFMNDLNRFRSTFNGNAEQQVRQMLQNGLSQNDFYNAYQQALQIKQMLGR